MSRPPEPPSSPSSALNAARSPSETEVAVGDYALADAQTAVLIRQHRLAYLQSTGHLEVSGDLAACQQEVLGQFLLHPVLAGLAGQRLVHLRGQRVIIENLHELVLQHHRAGDVGYVDDLR